MPIPQELVTILLAHIETFGTAPAPTPRWTLTVGAGMTVVDRCIPVSAPGLIAACTWHYDIVARITTLVASSRPLRTATAIGNPLVGLL